jgi:energy-converting hydrogenase Eha subunit C
MADVSNDPRAMAQEVHQHEETFHSFNKLVLFAILNVGLVLACLALAFLGHSALPALLIGLGGTIVLIVGFTIAG